MIGGCALNHGLEKVRVRGKGPCAKVWDVRARWLCTVCDMDPHTFNVLISLIEDHLAFQNNAHTPQLPVPYQLGIALYQFGHFGNAASVKAVAQFAGCSEGGVIKST